MTDMIPRDAAIGALEERRDKYRQDSTSWMQIQMDVLAIQAVPIIPVIDPAAIREAALREAAAVIIDIRDRHEVMPSRYEIMPQRWREAIIALIGEKK